MIVLGVVHLVGYHREIVFIVGGRAPPIGTMIGFAIPCIGHTGILEVGIYICEAGVHGDAGAFCCRYAITLGNVCVEELHSSAKKRWLNSETLTTANFTMMDVSQ